MSVIEIGDFSIARRERSKWNEKRCNHNSVETDDEGQIVRCRKCGETVSAYWALSMLARDYQDARAILNAERAELEKDKQAHIHLKAARRIERVWRGSMAPLCPHCGRAILATDGMGNSCVNRENEEHRRAHKQAMVLTCDETAIFKDGLA